LHEILHSKNELTWERKKYLVKIPTQHVRPNPKKTGEYFSKMWGQMKNSVVNKMSRYMFIWSRVFNFSQFCDVWGEYGIIHKRNVPNLVTSRTGKQNFFFKMLLCQIDVLEEGRPILNMIFPLKMWRIWCFFNYKKRPL